jgi:hypothetical protein
VLTVFGEERVMFPVWIRLISRIFSWRNMLLDITDSPHILAPRSWPRYAHL